MPRLQSETCGNAIVMDKRRFAGRLNLIHFFGCGPKAWVKFKIDTVFCEASNHETNRHQHLIGYYTLLRNPIEAICTLTDQEREFVPENLPVPIQIITVPLTIVDRLLQQNRPLPTVACIQKKCKHKKTFYCCISKRFLVNIVS